MPPHILGKIILPGKPVFRIMVIGIAGTIAQILHHPRRGIQDMGGGHQRAGFPCRFRGGVIGFVGRIGFGGRRQIKGGLCNGQFPLRTA